jgi:hypothetical protein
VILVGLVCGKEVKEGLLSLSMFARELGVEITDRKPEALSAAIKPLLEKMDAVTAAMRKEMGID